MDRADKLASRVHSRLFCLTKWVMSYKGQEAFAGYFEPSAGDFARFVLDRTPDRIGSIGSPPARVQVDADADI